MKKLFSLALIIISMLVQTSCDTDFFEESEGKSSGPSIVPVITFLNSIPDEEVNTVFRLTNDFRTGSEAYYRNEANTDDIRVANLSCLSLDANLCRAAKIRAEEIVSSWGHVRPDGRSCETVLNDLSIARNASGENIAAGNQSGERTFLQWKEDGKPYSGQGHRRNMLSRNFSKIGIAGVYAPDSQYKYYWVMILTD